MTFAERAEKRARAIYEAALFSTLMQQESAATAELGDEFDFDVTLHRGGDRRTGEPVKPVSSARTWKVAGARACR
jgi:hypothetical protein